MHALEVLDNGLGNVCDSTYVGGADIARNKHGDVGCNGTRSIEDRTAETITRTKVRQSLCYDLRRYKRMQQAQQRVQQHTHWETSC
jgi:hypothetical protein